MLDVSYCLLLLPATTITTAISVSVWRPNCIVSRQQLSPRFRVKRTVLPQNNRLWWTVYLKDNILQSPQICTFLKWLFLLNFCPIPVHIRLYRKYSFGRSSSRNFDIPQKKSSFRITWRWQNVYFGWTDSLTATWRQQRRHLADALWH